MRCQRLQNQISVQINRYPRSTNKLITSNKPTPLACIFRLNSLVGRYTTSIQITGYVNNIPTMQFFTGKSINTQSKSYRPSLSECVWEFRNTALWDTH